MVATVLYHSGKLLLGGVAEEGEERVSGVLVEVERRSRTRWKSSEDEGGGERAVDRYSVTFIVMVSCDFVLYIHLYFWFYAVFFIRHWFLHFPLYLCALLITLKQCILELMYHDSIAAPWSSMPCYAWILSLSWLPRYLRSVAHVLYSIRARVASTALWRKTGLLSCQYSSRLSQTEYASRNSGCVLVSTTTHGIKDKDKCGGLKAFKTYVYIIVTINQYYLRWLLLSRIPPDDV